MAIQNINDAIEAMEAEFFNAANGQTVGLTYTPKGGTPRTVQCVIEGDVVPKLIQNEQGYTQVQQLEIHCFRGVQYEPNAIASPRIGDSVVLPSDIDASERPWFYSGESRETTRNIWILIFDRANRESRGAVAES